MHYHQLMVPNLHYFLINKVIKRLIDYNRRRKHLFKKLLNVFFKNKIKGLNFEHSESNMYTIFKRYDPYNCS